MYFPNMYYHAIFYTPTLISTNVTCTTEGLMRGRLVLCACELSKSRCWVVSGNKIFVPNFLKTLPQVQDPIWRGTAKKMLCQS